MKIVLTVHQFLPDYSAGTEILTFETAQGLRRLGHEVIVFAGYPARVALRDEERFDHYEVAGIPVERFHHSHVAMGGQENTTEAEYNNLLFARYFKQFLNKFQPDVVHFFHLGRLSASAVDVCHQLGIPMVLTPTDFWFVCPTNQLRLPDNSMCAGPNPNGVNCLRHVASLNQAATVRSQLDQLPDWILAVGIQAINRGMLMKKWFSAPVKALYRRPSFLRQRINLIDRVLAPTQLMRSILVGNGVQAEKITLCRYGIKLGHVSGLTRVAERSLRIGFIGTLYEHKAPHLLVSAVRLLPADPPLELKIYGRLDEFPAYVERLKGLAGDDPRIKFCGPFPNEQIGKIFSELDVLVVPSIWYENTPLVIYSAQAAGCPVIASNLGGMSEVIHHGINGLLFEAGDAGALAHLLAEVCADRVFLKTLAARAIPPKSDLQYVAEIEEVYRQLLHNGRRSGPGKNNSDPA